MATALSVANTNDPVSPDNFNTYEQTCDTIDQLRSFIGVTGVQVYARGTSAVSDGGQGIFYWNASGTAPDDNGVTTVVPFGSVVGEWTRQSPSFPGTSITAAAFIPSGTAVPTVGLYNPSGSILNTVWGLSAASTLVLLGTGVASAVNYITMENNVTGSAPLLAVAGSDTNISFTMSAKGSGSFAFQNNSSAQQATIGGPANAVNYITLSGGTSGNQPIVGVAGADTNIQLNIIPKGAAAVALYSNNSIQMNVTGVANTTNYMNVEGATVGSPPSLTSVGTDTNISLLLNPKGTGVVQVGNAGSFAVNGSVATSVTSLGPAGSHTTVQKWLTIQDNGGNTFYIPCF